MEEALRYFVAYEVWIYIGLGGLALWEIRKFALAWEEVRGASFGLERESAQNRLNRSAIMLVLTLMMAISEFVLVSFVAPTIPGAMPLLTPTIDLLATPSHTLLPGQTVSEDSITPLPPEPGTTPGATLAPTLQGSGCIPGQLEISEPQHGTDVSGSVTLIGTVDVPNFGFYEYEVARPGDPIWLTVQAGREIKQNEPLGELDTQTLPPGDLQLRLVAYDNAGQEQGACTILIRIPAADQP